jgi:hypothetical protein
MKEWEFGLARQLRRMGVGLLSGCAMGIVSAQTSVPDTAPIPPISVASFTSDSSSPMWVSVGVGSQHLQNASQYNQQNFGLGVEIPFQADWLPVVDTRYALGFFRNSERARSIYAGAFLFPFAKPQDPIKLGALVGVINGYERANHGGFFPLVVPTLAFEQNGFGANLFLVPPVAGIPATLALQVKMGY